MLHTKELFVSLVNVKIKNQTITIHLMQKKKIYPFEFLLLPDMFLAGS